MSVFLLLKQVVDMLYQFKILDYGMVAFSVILLGNKAIHDKVYLDISKKICIADILVTLLAMCFVFSFFRDTDFYGNIFKIISAFLVYFLGRVYGEKIIECSKYLGIVGYIIIYLNFIYRYYIFGFRLFLDENSGLLNTGAFYYYKTDLAVGVIIASIFIYIFGKNKYLKWFTIIPVTSYMVFYSGARMGMITLIVEYLVILIYEVIKRRNIRVSNNSSKIILTACSILVALVIGAFVTIQIFVKGNTSFQPYIRDEYGNPSLLEKLFHSRHVIWWEVSQYFSEQSLWTRLVGIDLGSEPLHNSAACAMHSMYFKLLYSVGYIGTLLFTVFISCVLYRLSKCKERDLVYLVVALLIVFAVMGLTAQSLESTQMSWFMMLYAGAAFSTGVKINEETIYKPHTRGECSRN